MGQCTVQNVFDGARAKLRDDLVAGGTSFTNSALQAHFAAVYRKMFDAFDGIGGANRVRHTQFINIPANTGVWIPNANGVTDMAEPEVLAERGALTTGNITSTSTGTPINVLATGHGLGAAGVVADVVLTGIANTMVPWGRWWATVVDANNFTLNGSASSATDIAGSGGTFSYSTEKFVDMYPISRVTDRDISSSLIDWLWENNAIYFRGANTLRQVRIIYVASGTAPTNASTVIMIDNVQNLLETGTAAYAAESRGWYDRADRLFIAAFGPQKEANATGGMLRDLIAPTVLEMQRETRTPRTFRPSKSQLTPYWS